MNEETPNAQQSETERTLREHERRLATLLSNLPGMAYRCKNDRDWTMKFVSGGCEALTGYKAIDLIGVGATTYNSLIHPDDRDRIWNEVQEAVTRRLSFRLTYRIRAADGREKWVWEQGVGVGSGAEPEALEGFIIDITELKEAESKYRNIFEGAIEGMYRISIGGKPLATNPALAKMLGYESPEEVCRAVSDTALQIWLDPNERQGFLKLLLDRGVVLGYESQLKRKDGTPVWASINSRVVRGVDGTALYDEGFVEDITERKRAEEDLRQANEATAEAEANLSALIESTDDLIGSVDLEYRLVTFNKALRDNIKWNVGLQAAVGMRFEDWLPSERLALWPPMFERALSEGPFRTEYILLDGRTLELSFNPIRRGGQAVGISIFGKDITERKTAEKTLREAETNYRSIFDGAVEGIYRTTIEGKPITGNAALAKMLGYESTEEGVLAVNDVTLQVWLNPDKRSDFLKLLQDQGVVLGYECQFKRKDGAPVWVSLNSRIVRDVDGTALYVEGFVEDITGRKRSEAALKQANETIAEAAANLSALIESTEDLIGSFDLEYRLLTFNKALANTIKSTVGVEATVGMRPEDWLPAGKVALWPPMFGRALSEGPFRAEYPTQDGRTLELSFNPIRQDGGTVGISVFGKNITERKRAQATIENANEVIAEAERRYRLMFNSVSDAVFVHKFGKDGLPRQFLEVNDNACHLLGYTREELLQLRVADIIAPEEHFNPPANAKRLLADGHSNWEGLLSAKDGRRIPVEVNARVFKLDGAPTIISSVRDISERKQAEASLRESEEGHRSILHTAMEGFWLTNTEGRLLEINETYCRMSGYGAEELLTMGIADLVDNQTADETAIRIKRLMAQGEARFESRHRRKDGSTFEVEASVQYRPVDGGRFVCFLRDITERRRAEADKAELEDQLRQAQKLESIGKLAGGVAHDFNNLLTIINGYSDFLLRGLNAGDPLRSHADQIRTAGERATALTKQLLAFSRKQVIEPKVLDLNVTIRQSAPMLQRLIGEDIDLETYLDESLGRVLADPDQIHQVIMNLAVNARDAMPDGGTLDIETMNVELDETNTVIMQYAVTPGRYVLMSVTDTGLGMDEATRQQIFEPFFTTKEIGKGTGLGLATVYGIIRQGGGWIEVQSEVGVGTSFKVYLPRIDASLPPVEHEISVATEKGSETILVVEDQEGVRSFTKTVLERHGYQVIETSDGEEAIAAAGNYSGEVHLLLTDVVLPGMNGKELSEMLKAFRPNLKVLFTSGYTADAIGNRGVLGSDVAFLHKPFSPDELAAKVRSVLRPL